MVIMSKYKRERMSRINRTASQLVQKKSRSEIIQQVCNLPLNSKIFDKTCRVRGKSFQRTTHFMENI